MNPDLPQFEHGLEGWMEVNTMFDLAPYLYAIPVAVQVFGQESRELYTGIITSTGDEFAPGSKDNDWPIHSVIYFKDADMLRIDWTKTKAVLAMVAVVTGEEENNGEGRQDGGSDPRPE